MSRKKLSNIDDFIVDMLMEVGSIVSRKNKILEIGEEKM